MTLWKFKIGGLSARKKRQYGNNYIMEKIEFEKCNWKHFLNKNFPRRIYLPSLSVKVAHQQKSFGMERNFIYMSTSRKDSQ